MTVAEVMKRDVMTVSPETMVEKAVAIAQANRVGCLPVLEEDSGGWGLSPPMISSTKVLNPLFGIGRRGARLKILSGADPKNMEKVLDGVNKFGLHISSVWKPSVDPQKSDLIIQFGENDVTGLVEGTAGFRIRSRAQGVRRLKGRNSGGSRRLLSGGIGHPRIGNSEAPL